MSLTFTYEYPLITRTSSATAPVYEIAEMTARNTLQRARLSADIEEISKDLYEAAEHLIRGENVPPHVETNLYNVSAKLSELTYQDALIHLSEPVKGSNSLVGVTTTYEKYKEVDEVQLIRVLAEESLLTKAVARGFGVRLLKEAGVDLSQLFSEDELKKFNISQEDSTGALYRLADGEYQIYDTIPMGIRGESVYIMGVEKDGITGNMMTSVVQGKEFDEYKFDYEEGDQFTVHLRFCLKKQNVKGKSWSEEQEFCLQEIKQNTTLCDVSLQRDAGSGVLSVENYLDRGISTSSKEFLPVSSFEERVDEIKGWQGLFQGITAEEQRDITMTGASQEYFEPYARWYVEEARTRLSNSENMNFVSVLSDVVLFQVLCGGLAYRLDIEHLLKQPFNCLITGAFDTLDFVQSLYKLHQGIGELLTNRLELATKRTYFKKEEKHHINVIYAEWAGCQCFLQEKFTNYAFQEQLNKNIYYQFIDRREKEGDVSVAKGGARSTLAGMITRYKSSDREYRICDSADHILGFYLHQNLKLPRTNLDQEYMDYRDSCVTEQKQRFLEIDIIKKIVPFEYRLDSSLDFPDYVYFNRYLEQASWNQSLRVCNEQKRYFDVAPSSSFLPDSQLVESKIECQERFSEHHYKIQQDQSESEAEEEVQDLAKTYYIEMLENEAGVELPFGDYMSVIIPHEFIEMLGIHRLEDFRNASRELLARMGFVLQETALFVDLADYSDDLSPFLMFDAQIGHYYVPAFFNGFDTSMSRNFGFSSEQTAQILTAAISQPPISVLEGENNISNIMTLIDLNQVYRKLAEAIREYKVGNFSCFEFMGRKVYESLERERYLEIIKTNLNSEDGAITFYAPTGAERQAIEAETAYLGSLSGMSRREILAAKPTGVQDYFEEHCEVYSFAADRLDELSCILKDTKFTITEFEPEYGLFYDYYVGAGDRRLEGLVFGAQVPIGRRPACWADVLQMAPEISSPTELNAGELLLMARIRGVQLGYLLRNGLASPDEPQLNVQKFHDFDSVEAVFARFGGECANAPISLRGMTEKPFSAPLFYKLTVLEKSGQAPLKDVFGRVLRAAAPYSMSCLNTVENIPAPLENEAPPPPAANGEESTLEQVISFWRRFQQSHYNIDQSTIKALMSPLFCLEEREYEEITVSGPAPRNCTQQDQELGMDKINHLVACRCTSAEYILYPPNNAELDSFMRGIYYMSPYYIPACEDSREELFETLQKTCNYAVSVICQLLRDGIDRYTNMPNISPETRPPPAVFTDVVMSYFQAECQNNTYEHIVTKFPMHEKLPRRELTPPHSRDFDFRQVQNNRLLDLLESKERVYANDKFALSDYIKSADFWSNSTTPVDKMQQLAPLIELILQSHPILDVLSYGQATDSRSSIALEVHRFLSLGKLGKAEDEQRELEGLLARQMPARDEIYEQLVEMQRRLRDQEEYNINTYIRLAAELQQARYLDLHDQICDLYATVVNAAFARACACDKKLHPQAKISPDQQISGGFETGGPDPEKVADWQNEALRDLAVRNGLAYGAFEWPDKPFDIADIVAF